MSTFTPRVLLALTAVACGLVLSGSAEAADPLVLETTIPLEGVAGRIDHLAVDLGRQRLIVAELGNHTVEVIDLAQAKSLQRIGGFKEPQGVRYVPGVDRVVIADGGDGTVHILSGGELKPAGTIDLGDDADNVRLGPQDGQVIVGYGSGALAVIDVAAAKRMGEIKLAGHPESFQLDLQSEHVFVNVPAARQIAVASLDGMRQTETWDVKGRRSNFPLAITPEEATVASVFRSPEQLVLFDAASGAVRQELATCGDSDDVFFDPKRQRIYVSCGAGVLDVFEKTGGGYGRTARMETASGARTSLFVPELDRLFVAAPARPPGNLAKILVFRPLP